MAEKPAYNPVTGQMEIDGVKYDPTKQPGYIPLPGSEKPDFSTPQTPKNREEELQEAIEFSKEVEKDSSLLGEDADTAKYWESVQDIQAKLDIIKSSKDVIAHPELYKDVPKDYQQKILGLTSPFVTHGPSGATVNITSAIKTGNLSAIRGIVTPAQVSQAEYQVSAEKILRQYGGDPEKAMRAGKWDEIKGLYSPEDQVALQSAVAESGLRQSALSQIPPLVITVQEGKEQLNLMEAGKWASQGKLSASTLRNLGYDVSEKELEEWAKASSALDQTKVKTTTYQETPFGSMPITTYDYDYIGGIKKGVLTPEILGTVGFTPEDIKSLVFQADIETKLEPYRKESVNFMSPSFEKVDTTDIGKAVVEGAVTKADLVEYGYTEKAVDRAQKETEVGLKSLIPVYGTVALWSVLEPWERGLGVVGDIAMVVPMIGWAGSAGLKTAIAGTRGLTLGARLGTIGRTTGRMGLEVLKSPFTVPKALVTHPWEFTKGYGQAFAFPFTHPVQTTKSIFGLVTGGYSYAPKEAVLLRQLQKLAQTETAAAAAKTKPGRFYMPETAPTTDRLTGYEVRQIGTRKLLVPSERPGVKPGARPVEPTKPVTPTGPTEGELRELEIAKSMLRSAKPGTRTYKTLESAVKAREESIAAKKIAVKEATEDIFAKVKWKYEPGTGGKVVPYKTTTPTTTRPTPKTTPKISTVRYTPTPVTGPELGEKFAVAGAISLVGTKLIPGFVGAPSYVPEEETRTIWTPKPMWKPGGVPEVTTITRTVTPTVIIPEPEKRFAPTVVPKPGIVPSPITTPTPVPIVGTVPLSSFAPFPTPDPVPWKPPTPEPPKPPTKTPPIIPPILPGFGLPSIQEGRPKKKGIRKLLEGGRWNLPEQILHLPDPFSFIEKGYRGTTSLLARQRTRKYGVKEPTPKIGGMRL